ncbi:MAG TPA: hypothetical protein VI306_14670 [Pyrinomonadaceae bacterium]
MNKSSRVSFCLTIVVLLGVIVSCATTDTRRNYVVRVYDSESKKGVADAQVIVELKDGSMQAPQRTDTNGYARFAFPKEYEGKPIRLIVQNDGYEVIRQEFDFAMQLPQEIMLTPKGKIGSTSSNLPTPSSPPVSQSPREEPSPVTAQEIYGILIETVGNRRVGDIVYLNLRLTNNTSEAKLVTLFGAGLYGKAKLYSDGNPYDGSYVTVGSEERELLDVRIPGNTYVNANVVFKGIPTNLHSATVIEIPYSYQNGMPDGRMHFTKIDIN